MREAIMTMPLTKSREEWQTRLTDNAIDFLNRAIDEFKDRPKYSIINFYTAVELFLKARLSREHWSLIVRKSPDRKKFEAGDFDSVTFDEACERLKNVVESPVPERARNNFDAIRKHRNKMVHFFHDVDGGTGAPIEVIAREQLRAWYDLHKLLTVDWRPAFVDYAAHFALIEKKLTGHREFLRAKFNDLAPLIKAESSKGAQFRMCGSCAFKSARTRAVLGALFESECLVCRYRDRWVDYNCSKCGVPGRLREGGDFACGKCGAGEDHEAIYDRLNEFVATPDNYFEAPFPAHCSECEGYQTVAEYKGKFLCVVCLSVSNEVGTCGWCGESGTGDMEDSGMTGCTVCDGSIGHQMSKDD
jgi:hypothetical protein